MGLDLSTARSLYGCWRRLAAEKFPHYTEGWLWVPSLAQPNPDFQFKHLGRLAFSDRKSRDAFLLVMANVHRQILGISDLDVMK